MTTQEATDKLIQLCRKGKNELTIDKRYNKQMTNRVLFLLFFFVSINCVAQKKKNVVFIAVDDLNTWIGPLKGHPQVKTPNLDKLFSKGVYFTNAHTAQAVCTVSRPALLAGLHPVTTGWYSDTKAMSSNYDKVMKNHQMLPEMFKNNGYKTYSIGKIFDGDETDFPTHTADYWTEYSPHFWNNMPKDIKANGYGYLGYKFYPFPKNGGQLVQAYGKENIIKNYMKTDRFYSLSGGPLDDKDIPPGGMYDEQIANWAVNKLQNQKTDVPFFLAVGFLKPHLPYAAPKKYFDLYPEEGLYVPPVAEHELKDVPVLGKVIAYGFTPQGDWADVEAVPGFRKELVRSYLACISFLDDQVGKVINALEKSPFADNTIIVLWSDHGQHLGEKKHYRKQSLWKESTQSVLYMYDPETQVNGASKRAVSLLDIYPTLMDLTGLPKNNKLDGRSLLPLIKNPDAKWPYSVLSTWGYKNFAIIDENYRYIQYKDGSQELYNKKTDPGELINIAQNNNSKKVIKKYQQYIPKASALPVTTAPTTTGPDKYDKLISDWKKNGIPAWLE